MADLKQVILEMKKKVEGIPQVFADIFVERVKARTPVLSGTLQKAWGTELTPQAVVIKNDVPYAGFVEYGTVHMSPRGMMRATILERDQIMAEATQKVKL